MDRDRRPQPTAWVADDAAGGTTGFVAAKLHREQKMGEIYMIAVDPSAQSNGIGAMLTEAATDWLPRSGMRHDTSASSIGTNGAALRASTGPGVA